MPASPGLAVSSGATFAAAPAQKKRPAGGRPGEGGFGGVLLSARSCTTARCPACPSGHEAAVTNVTCMCLIPGYFPARRHIPRCGKREISVQLLVFDGINSFAGAWAGKIPGSSPASAAVLPRTRRLKGNPRIPPERALRSRRCPRAPGSDPGGLLRSCPCLFG